MDVQEFAFAEEAMLPMAARRMLFWKIIVVVVKLLGCVSHLYCN